MSKRLTKTIWYGSDVDSNGNPILPSTHGGLDGLNYGELFLHLSIGKASLWTLSSDGKIVGITGGGSGVDMSSYLLKSIWDKVFEIRTDSQGKEYIFGKLPMVTQYGISMYSGDGVDIPSLASGLPFDGRTIWYNPETNQIEVIGGTGGGSGEGVSNFWDLSGIPSWITNSKPKYSYSEIDGTPDLSGFATQNWIKSQGYASAEELKKYIPISGYTEVSGEKNFTGGLKVNGSPIYYDTEKKYWKLEGDLLVTGGVTMYGSDSSFTPSTIMDALLYDDATLGINSNGQLYVKGGTSGGGLDITALQNYLTQNSYLNVTSGDNRYLKLSGGTISGISGNYTPLIIETQSLPEVWLQFKDAVGNTYIGSDKGQPAVYIEGDHNYLILHSGNYSNYALPLTGGTITISSYEDFIVKRNFNGGFSGITYSNANEGALGYIGVGGADSNYPHQPMFSTRGKESHKIWHSGNDGSDSGMDADLLDGQHLSDILASNVASATKLQTARTIWGQSFDGTGNVSGNLTLENNYEIVTKNTSGSVSSTLYRTKSNNLAIGEGIAKESNDTYISGNNLFLRYSTGQSIGISLISSGNVGIGTTSPQQKLHVEGHVWANGDIAAKTKIHAFGNLIANDNVGIGTESPSAKLHIVNNTNTLTGLRLDGGWSGYGFLYNGINIFLNGEQYGGIGVNTVSSADGSTAAAGTYITNAKSGEYMNFYNEGGTFLKSSLLVNGGITMYSDQRKKTILNHVELSLKQIAEAPLIEHYYNSDEKKTTHVGSIAQYWASMNDWFCKLDSEGYYTMEIQNAALASAISIARELDRYETKTDKAIKKLKKRICELEEEVERLKSA